MRLFTRTLIISACLFFVAGHSYAEYKPHYAPTDSSYIDDKDRGWFFYEKELPPEEELEEELVVAAAPVSKPEKIKVQTETKQKIIYVSAPPKLDTPKEAKEKPLIAFGAKWFRKYLPDIKDKAIDNPTDENMLAYLYAQRITFDKSTNFRKAYTSVIARNPILDEERRYPVSKQAKNAINRKAEDAKNGLIVDIFNKAGIYVIYDESCYLCATSVGVLERLEDQYGANILKISMDGKINKHPYYKNSQVDTSGILKRRFNVSITPSFILVKNKDEARKIGEGSMMLDKIIDRILPFALDMKIITRDDMKSTSNLVDETNMADILSTADTNKITSLEEKISANPNILIDLFKGIGE